MAHHVTLIPGDWIGPETCQVAQDIIAAAGVDIRWDTHEVGEEGVSETLLASCRKNRVILKAKIDAQRSPGKLPPTITLRKELGLWATIRPVQALPGVNARFPGLDLLVIRETSEDIYSGFEHEVTSGVFEAVKVTTRSACERISRRAYEEARRRGRSKVTIVHKSNIMKQSDGMFLKVAREIGKGYPDIQTEEAIVDALCMRMVRNPRQFDVLLALNLFGDIVSDLASGLAGGITASPSASHGGGIAMFENLHGNAPELVGNGRSNPIPMLRTAVMMLEHLGETEAAGRIERALFAACEAGLKTADLGGQAGCAEVKAAILSRL
ncbi:MAG: isocitrate/isopropylmalate family dehydrogenase [Myxococcota bacterium]|nr:isocitrate/isopropylmalate family dehydrogenase [Myxococcota bacterium]